MKKNLSILLLLNAFFGHSQNSIGIGTIAPNSTALLHVEANNEINKGLLVTGNFSLSGTMPNLGAGSRLMFYPGKGAFRAGTINSTQWDNSNIGYHSTAMGLNTTAKGLASAAFGNVTSALGDNSTAMGAATTASGNNSMAGGAIFCCRRK